MHQIKALTLLFTIVLSTGQVARANTTPSQAPVVSDLSPIRDALNYFFIGPFVGVASFVQHSVDDVAEEAVKFGTIYFAYNKTPLSRFSPKRKAAALPIVYIIANSIGDAVGDFFEPSANVKEGAWHNAVGVLINDFTEDVFKIGCYSANLASGYAPSMLIANFAATQAAPSWVCSCLTIYAYFSAITKAASDVNQCGTWGNAYGHWAESKWNGSHQTPPEDDISTKID